MNKMLTDQVSSLLNLPSGGEFKDFLLIKKEVRIQVTPDKRHLQTNIIVEPTYVNIAVKNSWKSETHVYRYKYSLCEVCEKRQVLYK